MPKSKEEPDKHLRLVLDDPELYEAWQSIKKHEGIRTNTDALRNLILEKAREIELDYSFLEQKIAEFLDKREKRKKEKD